MAVFQFKIMSKKKNKNFRFWIDQIHLYLGLVSGIILFIVCITGTIYVFRDEIERALEPQKYHVDKREVSLSKEQIISDFLKIENGALLRLQYAQDHSSPLQVSVAKSKDDRRGEAYLLNPYDGELLGEKKGVASEFFTFIFKAHRWLTLEDTVGRPIVGWSTVVFLLLSISGIILWLPRKIKSFKSFKPGLKIKWSGSWKRINHDLHNTLGFYTLPVIVLLCITGLCWSFESYRTGLGKVIGAEVFAGRGGSKIQSDIPKDSLHASVVKLDELIQIADSQLPEQGTLSISLPKGAEGVYEITKVYESKFNVDASDKLIIDQYSGVVRSRELFSEKKKGEQFASQIKAWHLGTIFGLKSKILYFICGLIASSFPITGILIWVNKLRK